MKSPRPIAIVGMACRFPDAPNLSRYWQLLRDGRHAFRQPPADRWDHAAFFSESHRAADRYYAPNGAFIDDVRSFAALEFGIPPRRLEVMDPQQRITLEASWNAVLDAGYGPALDDKGTYGAGGSATLRKLNRRRIGTFVGVTGTEYRTLLVSRAVAGLMAAGTLGTGTQDPAVLAAIAATVNRVVPTRAFSAAGLLGNMVAASVSQELDFGGPAYTLDAACASALVALHDACTWLRDGQIDAALAGGVYLNLSPENLIAFSRIGAISASGVCRPFDALSDGFVQGEGVGMVMLKRLEDAVADNDRIYAVIAGSSCNNDGRGDGPMSPRPEGQIEVMHEAWEEGGITAESIGYVEAHGTGTSVGDRTELTALRSVLQPRRASGVGPVALGSAKGNIGHTMSAAGVAGLIKAALAVHHKVLPPLANWSKPHPDHALDDGMFAVDTAPRPWHSVTPRRATVSSFGFGGTNGHIVLQQPPEGRSTRLYAGRRSQARIERGAAAPAAPVARFPASMPQLVVVSAESGLLLGRYLLEIAASLADVASQADAFASVVQTLNLARRRRAVSCAVVASSLDELEARFCAAAAALAANPATHGNLDRDTVISASARTGTVADPVAFLCPGQGMQKVGLLRDWLELPVFAAAMQEMEAAVRDITPRPLLSYLYAPDATEDALTDTAIAQPAMFAIGVSVARVLQSFGIEPAAILGHSLGEFTAAALAGGADAIDTIRFVARRGAAMSAMPGDHGAMAAVMAAPGEITPHLPAKVVIANRNHPRQNVIAGPTAAVEEAVRRLGEAQIKARRIPVSHAFHSPMLECVQADVDSGLTDVRFSTPVVRMASCIAEEPASSPEAVRAIFRRHATSAVEYVRGLGHCRDAGARIYVQLSGGATLTAFARGVLEDGEAIVSVAAEATPERPEGHDTCLGLVRVLALCAAHGHPVDLSSFGHGLASLPPVPLLTQEYWGVQASAQGAGAGMQLTGLANTDLLSNGPSWANTDLLSNGPSGEDDVRARVLRVVARVSAFPVDALKSEQRLLDDLGFDSLMVNELGSKLAEDFPGFGGLPRSLFAKNPTVLDLVTHVERSTAEQDVPLTDPSRPMEILTVTAAEAPLSGLKLPSPVRVLDQPSLDMLRALKPQDVVVRVREEHGALADELAIAGGIIGFVKALAREWPQHKVQVVCGELHDAEVEAAAAERDPEVLVLAGVRYVRALEGAHLDARPLSLRGERVLLTGGTGWLGQVLARALLSAGADEVILLGSRRDPGDALAELGARARYIQADLLADRSLDCVKNLGITHLVHAAGSLADGPVGSVDRAVRDRAWALKVSALGNLLRALTEAGHGKLRVTAIGSYAGFFGNAYQTEYAAANAAMSAVIRESCVPGGVQIWGPWDGSEMVGTIPAAMKREMREEGVWFVDRERGCVAFLAALRAHGDVVIGLDLPLVRRVIEVRETYTPDMPWLVDHALYGKPTVPMAVVADDALRLGDAVLGGGQGPLEVTDLTLFDGITVDKPVTVRRRIDGSVFSAWIGERLAWKAQLRPVTAPAAAPLPDASEAATAFDIPTFYREHTFHGPLLQGVVAIEGIGDAHVRGRVRIGSPGDWGLPAGSWHFSPLAVDSAFQLAAVWAIQKKGRAGFPVRVARWTQRPVEQIATADGTLSVIGVFRDADADRFRGDIWLVDDTGAIVAYGEGVEAELRQVAPVASAAVSAAASASAAPIPEKFWNFAKFPEYDDLDQRLSAALMLGIDNPYFKTLEGCARDTVMIGGKELIHFSGYNYLGFSGHPYVEQRVIEAVHRYGTSVSASRVASGERPIHAELEAHLARALDVEAALVFTAGHATNVTTIGHLFGPKDLLLHDELIHDSVFQGMKLSGATRRPFPHGDSAALGRMLTQLRQHYEKVCIIVEGVYSMDGDICDLPAFVALKKQHQCFLMVDEAHSFGVVGKRGLGVREHFNVPGGDVDIWMGTLSKTLSSCGGYIGGTQTLITLLKYTAPGFIFSAGLTPANTAAAIAALELMEREPETVKKLQGNAAFFYAECQRHGLDNGPAAGHSAVIPVIVGNSFHALLLSDALKKAGINVQPILYPAVADNASRLRFFLSSLHSSQQLAHTAETVARELGRIRTENPI